MYDVSHEMLLDLVRYYVESLHRAEHRHQLSGKREERWVMVQDNLTNILVQLRIRGYNPDEILKQVREELRIRFSHRRVTINIDGAARGNDNPDAENKSAIGFIIRGDGTEITRYTECLGSRVELPLAIGEPEETQRETVVATNNVSEYIALIRALEYLVDNDITTPELVVMSDSDVVVQQVNLSHATRAPHLLRLRNYALQLLRNYPGFQLMHLKREENSEVDRMINEALDTAENIKIIT